MRGNAERQEQAVFGGSGTLEIWASTNGQGELLKWLGWGCHVRSGREFIFWVYNPRFAYFSYFLHLRPDNTLTSHLYLFEDFPSVLGAFMPDTQLFKWPGVVSASGKATSQGWWMGQTAVCAWLSRIRVYECCASRAEFSRESELYSFIALCQWLIWQITEIYVVRALFFFDETASYCSPLGI